MDFSGCIGCDLWLSDLNFVWTRACGSRHHGASPDLAPEVDAYAAKISWRQSKGHAPAIVWAVSPVSGSFADAMQNMYL